MPCVDTNADPVAARRPARFEVDGPAVRERRDGARLQVEDLELHRIRRVAREHHMPSVRRHVRLKVVAGSRRELLGDVGAERLQPQAPLHRIHQRGTVRHPGERTRAGGQLRQVHFPKIIIVRDGDLVEHRPPLGRGAGREQHAGQRYRDHARRTARRPSVPAPVRVASSQNLYPKRSPYVRGRFTRMDVSWKISL